MESYKIIYLLWAPRGQEKARTRDILIGDVSLKLIGAGAERLTLHIADPESDIRAPAPKLYLSRPISAMASIHVDDLMARKKIEDTLRYSGFTIAGYLVEESIYTDYGGNRHASPATGLTDAAPPGVVTVNLLERPRRLSREEWIRRWHGIMSPVSEEIQPRARYVRNLVVETLTPGAHPFEGIVEECWPSTAHVTSSFLFYGARNPLQLIRNMCRILRAVKSFLDITKIRTTAMGEYFIRTK